MKIEEIQTRLDAMAPAMVEKGLRLPEANFTLRSNGTANLMLRHAKNSSVWPDEFHHIGGNLPLADQLDAADAWIAALPDPQTAGLRKYLGQLSDAMETARKNSLDDELVLPVKSVMQAVSGKLLPAGAA